MFGFSGSIIEANSQSKCCNFKLLPKALNVAMCSHMLPGWSGRGCQTRASTSCRRQRHGISDGFASTVNRYWWLPRFTWRHTNMRVLCWCPEVVEVQQQRQRWWWTREVLWFFSCTRWFLSDLLHCTMQIKQNMKCYSLYFASLCGLLLFCSNSICSGEKTTVVMT